MPTNIPPYCLPITYVFNDIGKRAFKDTWTEEEIKSYNWLQNCRYHTEQPYDELTDVQKKYLKNNATVESIVGEKVQAFDELKGLPYPPEEWNRAKEALKKDLALMSPKITDEDIEHLMRATVVTVGLRSVFYRVALQAALYKEDGSIQTIPNIVWLATNSSRALLNLQEGTVEYNRRGLTSGFVNSDSGHLLVSEGEYQKFIKEQFPETPAVSDGEEVLLGKLEKWVSENPTACQERARFLRILLNGYENPYIETMFNTILKLNITKENQPLCKNIVEHIKSNSSTLSDRICRNMATLVRNLESQKGGNRKK